MACCCSSCTDKHWITVQIKNNGKMNGNLSFSCNQFNCSYFLSEYWCIRNMREQSQAFDLLPNTFDNILLWFYRNPELINYPVKYQLVIGSNHSNTSVVLMMTIWIIDLFWIPLLDTINNPLTLGVPSNFFVAQEIGQQLKQILLLTMFKVWLVFFYISLYPQCLYST